MDTGAGWEGKLSLMNITTKEVFQSDPVCELYEKSTR
jgi:serine/threonine protein phosphatase 1